LAAGEKASATGDFFSQEVRFFAPLSAFYLLPLPSIFLPFSYFRENKS
jgi:hypothetical protein